MQDSGVVGEWNRICGVEADSLPFVLDLGGKASIQPGRTRRGKPEGISRAANLQCKRGNYKGKGQ